MTDFTDWLEIHVDDSGHDYMQHKNTDLHHYDNTRLAREHNISILYLFNSLRMMSTFNKFTMQ